MLSKIHTNRTQTIRKEAVRVAKVKSSGSSNSARKVRPALSPEARENQLISLAIDLVEQRLLDGTASSQETTHFLKLASSKAKYEKKLLEAQAEMAIAKKEALDAQRRSDEDLKEVIRAFRQYSGHAETEDD